MYTPTIDMEPGRKTHSTILALSLLGFSLIVVGFIEAKAGESLTGSFTDAHEPEKVYVEEVNWNFGGNETFTGRAVTQEFPKGEHNVTVTIEKSNGETEIQRAEVKIE